MPKYKIGITEAGDAGLITKNITTGFYNAVIEHKDKLIVQRW